MTAINSLQTGIHHLPLRGLPSPRVLMYSASMGAEGSVTLQLRETVKKSDMSEENAPTSLKIGNSTVLADIFGSLQSAALRNNNNNNNMESTISEMQSNPSSIIETTNNNNNNIVISTKPSLSTGQIVTINCSSGKIADSALGLSVPTANPPIVVRKPRPKTSSPTRHGPQQCQVCSKIFGNASALAKHKLTHSDERKYVCAICSKAFKRQDHLNGHMLTHRNKKPYECKAEGCGKSYCDARSLRRHTENHHAAMVVAESAQQKQGKPLPQPQTGPPTGLSLSPSTASGNANSPHGATCLQYTNNGDSSSDRSGFSSKPTSPTNCLTLASPAISPDFSSSSTTGVIGAEALSHQQLDLISQIINQKKQAKITAVQTSQSPTQRPRTWNIQTQLQNQNKFNTISLESVTSRAANNNTVSVNALVSNIHQQTGSSITQQVLNIVKIENKPVECNLCHRKFKNIPALNGHMRLHGGYFKKDTDTRKSEKKESPGPPLQTASIGVRALIEEKIISKRCKDVKGAFVVPAPPVAISVRRTPADVEAFLTPKSPTATDATTATISNNNNSLSQRASPGGLVQKKRLNLTIKTSNQSTSTDCKDATLIELLKRGTKVAIKRSSSPMQVDSILSPGSLQTTSSPIMESVPVELAMPQDAIADNDLFTVTYSTDSSSGYFTENGVFNCGNVSDADTAMLLQAVESIPLLNDSGGGDQFDEIGSMSEYSLAADNSSPIELQAALNFSDFGDVHSKDFGAFANKTNRIYMSPLASPLAYPTPPASHETVTQSSPYLDESHHFPDPNAFFDDKSDADFMDNSNEPFFQSNSDSELTESEKILKLKSDLEETSKSVFEPQIQVEELLKQTSKDFNDQNLSFLDDAQGFLDDSGNATAFFNQDVDQKTSLPQTDMDMYYLPGIQIQSHMMPNSEDPLLSSSPRDFGQRLVQAPQSAVMIAPTIVVAEKPRPTEALPEIYAVQKPIVEESYVIGTLADAMNKSSILKRRLGQGLPNTVHSKKQELFRSKLRRPSTTHYTPSPILNPFRKAPGLYCNIPKSVIHQDTIDLGDDFEDAASLVAFLDDSKVNIGTAYQATIPALLTDAEPPHEAHEKQMWDPKIPTNDKLLSRYIELSKSSAVPLGFHTEEVALEALLEAQGDTHIAVLSLLQSPSNLMHLQWSSAEVEGFLKGLERHGKDFFKIGKELMTKTPSDCIQFYYFWKKLCENYKSTYLHQDGAAAARDHQQSAQQIFGQHSSEFRSHACEMPDCSASFTSKAALHGHMRIHCIGRTLNGAAGIGSAISMQAQASPKDDFPCKVCGKVFNKVKSRSAHMKSHRPQEAEQSSQYTNQVSPMPISITTNLNSTIPKNNHHFSKV